MSVSHGSSWFRYYCAGAVTDVLLHPEYAAEVFADFFGSLTLAAASEKPIGGRECVGAEYKLILLPSAKGASLSVKFSADGSDSANLFVHNASSDWSGLPRCA